MVSFRRTHTCSGGSKNRKKASHVPQDDKTTDLKEESKSQVLKTFVN